MGDDHEGCGRHTINSSALADSTGRGQPTTERQAQASAADRVLSERPAPAPFLRQHRATTWPTRYLGMVPARRIGSVTGHSATRPRLVFLPLPTEWGLEKRAH